MVSIRKKLVSGWRQLRRLLTCTTRHNPSQKSFSPQPVPMVSYPSPPAPFSTHSSPHSPSHSSPHSSPEPPTRPTPPFDVLDIEELKKIPRLYRLGDGTFGCVDLVLYKGQVLAMKTHKGIIAKDLAKEVNYHLHLDGAGGAPRIHAVCLQSYAVLMDYTGVTYDKYLKIATPKEKLKSLIKIAESLCEIHDKHIIHNDLKVNNITVTFQGEEPELHLIDFGMATAPGTAVRRGDGCYWMAPDFEYGEAASSFSDIYSFGKLVCEVTETLSACSVLSDCLYRIVDLTQVEDPASREPLKEVIPTLYSFLNVAN
ncbi:Mitogen-activated protein kinase kinase 2-like [Homarus americanus]|uniref:Mitogen-activated protein kinase kinase 2-like n=1 Tax=Homarus americanus TaxID=6706 RepID=A0A8J5JXR3_HOMAM|nr:Mitogen-activated protein kinase kinase 2-like [Homarus americanus]